MIFVSRKTHFNAAHRLHNPEKSDQWNRDKYGVCNHANWHGHNYQLEVVVAGEPNPESGYLIDLSDLRDIIQTRIIDKCDHKNLNMDVDFLEGVIPTTENLVKHIYQELREPVEQACAPGGKLYAVRLQETERNSAEYCPYRLNEEILAP